MGCDDNPRRIPYTSPIFVMFDTGSRHDQRRHSLYLKGFSLFAFGTVVAICKCKAECKGRTVKRSSSQHKDTDSNPDTHWFVLHR